MQTLPKFKKARDLIEEGYEVFRNEVGMITAIFCPKCESPVRGSGFARQISESDAWTGEDELYQPCKCK